MCALIFELKKKPLQVENNIAEHSPLMTEKAFIKTLLWWPYKNVRHLHYILMTTEIGKYTHPSPLTGTVPCKRKENSVQRANPHCTYMHGDRHARSGRGPRPPADARRARGPGGQGAGAARVAMFRAPGQKRIGALRGLPKDWRFWIVDMRH
jgi:hypothetical protein